MELSDFLKELFGIQLSVVQTRRPAPLQTPGRPHFVRLRGTW